MLVSASPGDAITNVAMEFRSVLREVCDSEIFARHVDESMGRDVYHISRYHPRHSRNVLIFHASIGEPDLHGLLMHRREPLVLMYHNITPAKFYEPYDAEFADLLALGRREVERLRPRVVLALAASEFNAGELREMGYDNVTVMPPLVNPRRLAAVKPNVDTGKHLNVSFDAPILLSVAQLMPHKRPDFLVRAMHIAATYVGCEAFLMLIGHHRLHRYAEVVLEEIRELNLARVHVTGAVDDDQLAAFYRAAAGVVTASEHEGFGVPLLEAMAFDKPILARDCAAIPETLGGAGFLVPGADGPELYAEAIMELVANERLRDDLIRRGRERLTSFDTSRTKRALLAALLEVVVMRVLYVVQRYGETIAGGAEQHCRDFAERLVARGHTVAVATTCASSYVDWANVFDPGTETINGVKVHRFPVAEPRDNVLFSRLDQRMRSASRTRPRELQREWMRMQGPWTPDLVADLPHLGRAYDCVVFVTYLYWTTYAGLGAIGGSMPTLLHPTAHDEPPLRMSIFEEVFRRPDAFAYLTPEESELVARRFPGAPGGAVVGIGTDLDSAADGAAFRRELRPRRQAVSRLRRPRRPREGRG